MHECAVADKYGVNLQLSWVPVANVDGAIEVRLKCIEGWAWKEAHAKIGHLTT
jgi:hypothetical protein